MLTVPSIPPLLLEAHEHDTHFTPADHGGQTTLRLCNVLVLSCVHPCERFLKAPLGTTDAHWSPTCCLCFSDRRELDRGKSTLCHMFTKNLRSLKTGSYSFFAKVLDPFLSSPQLQISRRTAWQLIALPTSGPKSLLAERSMADFTSPRPYEVFKLVHSYFVRSARVPDHDSFFGSWQTQDLTSQTQADKLSFFLQGTTATITPHHLLTTEMRTLRSLSPSLNQCIQTATAKQV